MFTYIINTRNNILCKKMFICICSAISDHHLKTTINQIIQDKKIPDTPTIYEYLEFEFKCGKCQSLMEKTIKDLTINQQ